MALIKADALGNPLLRAVGIDPSTVRCVEVILEAGAVAEMRVHHYVQANDVPAIERVFRMTSWEEVPDATSSDADQVRAGESAAKKPKVSKK